jgi:transposase InsO family protein
VLHRTAKLTPFGRRLLVQRILVEGWSPAIAAETLGVSRATAYKWLRRYRAEGAAGLEDRSTRPIRRPRALSERQVRRILLARRRLRVGPHRLGPLLGHPRSTVYGVLRRHGHSRLAHADRLTGTPVRYVRERPGELVHVDVKRLGRVPPGGGHRMLGPTARNHLALGHDYLHVAIDDHSRLAYIEALPDERDTTCAGFLHRAVAWFREHGVQILRVLTDNAKVYRIGRHWAHACAELGLRRRFTKPGCPWTNGKAERFNRTLLSEFAYARPWHSNIERLAALDGWVQHYNTRRAHSALGGRPPITRLATSPSTT